MYAFNRQYSHVVSISLSIRSISYVSGTISSFYSWKSPSADSPPNRRHSLVRPILQWVFGVPPYDWRLRSGAYDFWRWYSLVYGVRQRNSMFCWPLDRRDRCHARISPPVRLHSEQVRVNNQRIFCYYFFGRCHRRLVHNTRATHQLTDLNGLLVADIEEATVGKIALRKVTTLDAYTIRLFFSRACPFCRWKNQNEVVSKSIHKQSAWALNRPNLKVESNIFCGCQCFVLLEFSANAIDVVRFVREFQLIAVAQEISI